MRIALDIDHTLADLNPAIAQKSNHFTEKELFDRDTFTDEDWQQYYYESQNVWENHWQDIPLYDEQAPNIIQLLQDMADTIDVVTSRSSVEENMRKWLDHHDIEYDSFKSSVQDKSSLGYDMYIDDSAKVATGLRAGQCFLIHREWNEHLNEGQNIIRVGDSDPPFVELKEYLRL